jgi:hypothetical protein
MNANHANRESRDIPTPRTENLWEANWNKPNNLIIKCLKASHAQLERENTVLRGWLVMHGANHELKVVDEMRANFEMDQMNGGR